MLYSERDFVLSQEERGNNISEGVNPMASSTFLIFLTLISRNTGTDF